MAIERQELAEPQSGEGEPADPSVGTLTVEPSGAPEGSPLLTLLQQSCEASGVPLRLEDEATAQKVAGILKSHP